MACEIPNGLDSSTWQPRHENWHFITVRPVVPGHAVTETKGTYNSSSSSSCGRSSGWVELDGFASE